MPLKTHKTVSLYRYVSEIKLQLACALIWEITLEEEVNTKGKPSKKKILEDACTRGGTRTRNLLIRSQTR